MSHVLDYLGVELKTKVDGNAKPLFGSAGKLETCLVMVYYQRSNLGRQAHEFTNQQSQRNFAGKRSRLGRLPREQARE